MRKYFPDLNKDEIWKDIIDYDNYQISDCGRVKNKTWLNILTPEKSFGYLRVNLYNENGAKKYLIHRLVATAFILNEDNNKTIVNHIDGNKINNVAINLEWTTASENSQHAIKNNLRNIYKRAINQLDLNGNVINTFESIVEACNKTSLNSRNMSSCLNGKRKTCGGYAWEYVNPERIGRTENDIQDLDNEMWKIFSDNVNYKVSTCGRIKNIQTQHILKTQINGGREYIIINNKTYIVSRMVAITFLPNYKNLPEVDHKDKNPLNNKLFNLRWISRKDNARHSRAKAVDQLDLNGSFIKKWNCITDIQNELKIISISKCCKGKGKTAGGFKWRYSDS